MASQAIYLNSENILIQPLSQLIPALTFINEQICIGLELNYTATGGSFSITLLQDSVTLPSENTVVTLPFGRIGIVKSTGRNASTSGLVDIISGPIVPLEATFQTFFGIEPNTTKNLSATAAGLGVGVVWSTLDIPIKNFSFRGIALSGIQQLAAYMLADVIVRKDKVYVVDPGQTFEQFVVLKSDIVSASQSLDYSQDVASILNPALTTVQLNDEGDFVYDSEHAQKQTKFTVQAGAPGGDGSSDHIDIPDGWLVDGNFEEWTPPPGTDFTNPASSVTNGRYWKVFQSPTNPGQLRGITNFNRIVKQLNIPGNVSSFVGSPITGLTKQNTNLEFAFNSPGTESGIYGFNAEETTLFDIISHQFLDLTNALVLIPRSGSSGEAATNFYSITMEMWNFPRVSPQVFGVGDPLNPFNIPKNVVVVNPNSNILITSEGGPGNYWQKYLSNYKLINSPRLKTNISTVFRNQLPQVGDALLVPNGLKYSNCGRIQSVRLSFGRNGIVLNMTAEKFQFGPGLWNGGTGTGFGG